MGFKRETIERIKAMVAAGKSCADIAKSLGINESTIRAIANHK